MVEQKRLAGCSAHSLDLAETTLGRRLGYSSVASIPAAMASSIQKGNGGSYGRLNSWWGTISPPGATRNRSCCPPSWLLETMERVPPFVWIWDASGTHVLRWSWIDGAVETDEGSLSEFLNEWTER